MTLWIHTELRKQIKALRTLKECCDFYETDAHFQECIRLARASQREYLADYPSANAEDAREEWAKTWALKLSQNEKGAEELNRCRKTALMLLYQVCDVGQSQFETETEAYRQIYATFKDRRLNQILIHFLPMDRANCLFNMVNTTTGERGLGWYSKGDEEAYQALGDPPLALNPESPSINKRFRKLQKNLRFVNERYGYWLEIAVPDRGESRSRAIHPPPPPTTTLIQSAPKENQDERFRAFPPRVESAKRSVVWVGLWNPQTKQFIHIGSGFIANAEKGLIVTAAHVLLDLKRRSDSVVMNTHNNLKDVVIGIISPDGYKAVHRYMAKIIAKDGKDADACILRIHAKILNGDPNKTRSIIEGDMHLERLQALEITKDFSVGNNVFSFGFNQDGHGIFQPGNHINYEADFTPGYIMADMNHSSTQGVGPGLSPVRWSDSVLVPRREIKIHSTTFIGHSGGPCLNEHGDVIGILSRADEADRRICYLVPVPEFEVMLQYCETDDNNSSGTYAYDME